MRSKTSTFSKPLFLLLAFLEPKGQGPQRRHDTKVNFSNSEYYPKDAPLIRSAHGEHRQQRNDRPPRFYRDADFPKPGQEPGSLNCTPSSGPAQGQQGKGQERWARGTSEKPHNDRREVLDGQSFPSSATTFTRSKDPQQQTEFSGSHQQRPRNGDGGGNVTWPAHRKGLKDGAPASKLSNSTGTEPDGKGSNKRPDRTEERNSNRRKYDRQSSDHPDRQRDGLPNAHLKGGGTIQDAGFSQDHRIMPPEHAPLQNGDVEHKRTGPIKPSSGPIREPPPRKNPSNNPGFKRRSGPGKGPRGPDRGHYVDHSWKPGDQCLALYWEDSKVCRSSPANVSLSSVS